MSNYSVERAARIIRHTLFSEEIKKTEYLERERVFCRHGMTHLMDVARAAWIITLERGLDIPKDVVYAAGLLHDVGRARQLEDGTPHDIAGAELAEVILKDTGYEPEEIKRITDAIRGHRKKKNVGEDALSKIIYEADKKTRLCFFCSSEKECNWSDEKKNHELIF